jgi:hypothetical protein
MLDLPKMDALVRLDAAGLEWSGLA